MKKVIFILFIIVGFTSCKKETPTPAPPSAPSTPVAPVATDGYLVIGLGSSFEKDNLLKIEYTDELGTHVITSADGLNSMFQLTTGVGSGYVANFPIKMFENDILSTCVYFTPQSSGGFAYQLTFKINKTEQSNYGGVSEWTDNTKCKDITINW